MLHRAGNIRLRMRRPARLALLAVVLLAGASMTLAATALSRQSAPLAFDGEPIAHADLAQQCPEPYPATRDPSNPLDLSTAPGPDPLNGARFFVPGPAKGSAAG